MGLGPEEMCEQVNFMLKHVMGVAGLEGTVAPSGVTTERQVQLLSTGLVYLPTNLRSASWKARTLGCV